MINKVAAVWLTYNRQDLSSSMEKQFKSEYLDSSGIDLFVIDNGSNIPITSEIATVLRKEENGYFTGGWNWGIQKLKELGYDYVWMLNDDVEGVNIRAANRLAFFLSAQEGLNLAVSPAFNSPHQIFHANPAAPMAYQCRWIDWCCPMVNLKAFCDLEMFDEDFKGYGADLILCSKARFQKYKMYVYQGVILNHLGSQTANSENKIDVMCNNSEMDRVIQEKYNLPNWMALL
jgi:GT2 family glycosyltransferase